VNLPGLCTLLMLLASAGCAAQPEATSSVAQRPTSAPARASGVVHDLAPDPIRQTDRTRSGTPMVVTRPPVPTGRPSHAQHARVPPDRDSAVRVMDEQARKWDAAMQKTLKTICTEC
jgi:hypothetical protein